VRMGFAPFPLVGIGTGPHLGLRQPVLSGKGLQQCEQTRMSAGAGLRQRTGTPLDHGSDDPSEAQGKGREDPSEAQGKGREDPFVAQGRGRCDRFPSKETSADGTAWAESNAPNASFSLNASGRRATPLPFCAPCPLGVSPAPPYPHAPRLLFPLLCLSLRTQQHAPLNLPSGPHEQPCPTLQRWPLPWALRQRARLHCPRPWAAPWAGLPPPGPGTS